MTDKRHLSSCEIPLRSSRRRAHRNRHYAFKSDYTWKGVKVERYKQKGDDWSDIIRQVLIGASGETTRFHVRYFEIQPGGFSSFEKHKHEHVVIGIRGQGRARVNKKTLVVKYLDLLYIKPDTPHRLSNPHSEPFGFLCIVNARRDRPVPVKK